MKKEIISKAQFQDLEAGLHEYEGCCFEHCDFSESNLSGWRFIDCEFVHCNFTMAKLVKTSLQDVHFTDSKLSGCRFDLCNQFLLALNFKNCILDHAVFAGVKNPQLRFANSRLHGADFTGAMLKQVDFADCDLNDAQFDHSQLEKCDFRTAINYRIDPELAKLKKSVFSRDGLHGLLSKYDLRIVD